MKKFFILLMGVAVLLSFAHLSFAATSVDALIEKLVDKKILTKSEAIDLKGEIAADEKLYREEGMQAGLPDWVKNTKLKGDLRVRYQYERQKNDDEARARGRIRYRLGLENKINEQVKVGAGLASGNNNDSRSTNQTFENNFEKPDIRLDYAYGEYAPTTWFKGIAGRFPLKDYLWTATDMLWDSDINPDGGSAHLEHKVNDQISLIANTGVWLLDENGKTDRPDPYLYYTQGGGNWKSPSGMFSAKAAGVYYGFNGVKGIDLEQDPSTIGNTNTKVGTVLKYDYDSVGATAELAAKKLFGGLPMNIDDKIAIFGDFIHNVDPEDDANGWSVGASVGHDKVNGKGQWQAKYIFVNLGKDAWLDVFPDSDRYAGITDVKAHEAILEYGLNKNVILSLDYYYGQRIKAAKNAEHLVQADVNFKF